MNKTSTNTTKIIMEQTIFIASKFAPDKLDANTLASIKINAGTKNDIPIIYFNFICQPQVVMALNVVVSVPCFPTFAFTFFRVRETD